MRRPSVPRAGYVAGAILVALAVGAGVAGTSSVSAARPPYGWQLSGTWEPVAPAAAGTEQVIDAVALADGDIAIFGLTQEPGAGVVELFSPASGSRTPVALDAELGSTPWGQFVLGPGGRLYSQFYTVDPAVEPWHLEESTRWALADDPDSASMAMASNGLAYIKDYDQVGEGTRLIELDLATDTELRRTSTIDGYNWWAIAGEPQGGRELPPDRVYLVDPLGVFTSYEPARNIWIDGNAPPLLCSQGADRELAAFGPGGRIYIPSQCDAYGYRAAVEEHLWAWDPRLAEWLYVGLPATGLRSWFPALVAVNGRLYAFAVTEGVDESYVFNSGDVGVVPSPEPVDEGDGDEVGGGGSAPDTALPPSPGPNPSLLLVASVTLLLGAAAVGLSSRRSGATR